MNGELTNELNEQCAEALGWELCRTECGTWAWFLPGGEMVHKWQTEWNPCGDWNDAAVLLKNLEDNLCDYEIKTHKDEYLVYVYYSFNGDRPADVFFADAETAPKAITLAFLKAKGVCQ
jgi:hypothetical protein